MSDKTHLSTGEKLYKDLDERFEIGLACVTVPNCNILGVEIVFFERMIVLSADKKLMSAIGVTVGDSSMHFYESGKVYRVDGGDQDQLSDDSVERVCALMRQIITLPSSESKQS